MLHNWIAGDAELGHTGNQPHFALCFFALLGPQFSLGSGLEKWVLPLPKVGISKSMWPAIDPLDKCMFPITSPW